MKVGEGDGLAGPVLYIRMLTFATKPFDIDPAALGEARAEAEARRTSPKPRCQASDHPGQLFVSESAQLGLNF
jgi:hypothetical protein